MARKILGLVLLVILVFAGVYWYRNYRTQTQLANGEIHCVGCMTPEEKKRFDRENSGDGPDGQSETKLRKTDAPTGFPETNRSATDTTNSPSTRDAAGQPATTAYGVGTSPTPVSSPVATSASGQVPFGAPVTDSLSANAPNEMHFGGRGTYQWYRQGNLTWRVDTTTGRTCIDFATMEEWRKQIVMSHGCGRDA